MGYRVTTLNVNTIEPAGNTLTLGASGDTIVATDSVNVNTVKDAGGNTLWVSNGSGTLSSVNSGFGDKLVLISSQTASDSASISFTSGITSTYKEYIFKFINVQSVTDNTTFGFQANVSGESGYNETISSTVFRAYHDEADTAYALGYRDAWDQASGTADQIITADMANDADQACCGELHLFNPASTTYVKNFYARIQNGHYADYSTDIYTGGYFNVTGAITEVQFKFASGNIAAGTLMMYGVL